MFLNESNNHSMKFFFHFISLQIKIKNSIIISFHQKINKQTKKLFELKERNELKFSKKRIINVFKVQLKSYKNLPS